MNGPSAEATARNRFFIIQLVRLSGIALILSGLLIWRGDIVQPGGNMGIGLPILIVGILDSTIVPRLLTRRWRSPRK